MGSQNLSSNPNDLTNYLGSTQGHSLGGHSNLLQMMSMGQNPQFQQQQVPQYSNQMQNQQGEYAFNPIIPGNMPQGMFYPPEFGMNQPKSNNFLGILTRFLHEFAKG